ncbi:MAG TPA: dienelactone hydrolase family protein [Streptosporangiaceae bacterium]
MSRPYDPFAPGPLAVGVSTAQAADTGRGRLFPVELWYPARSGPWPGPMPARSAPARPGPHPLVIFSHHSGGHRQASSFVGIHLASHGYVVAAMDHSEVVAPELAGRDGETAAERSARMAAMIASRVPDVRFLLDHLLAGRDRGGPVPGGLELDPERVGLAGFSFGGWTALAAPESEPRVRAVVALAPGGIPDPRPGVLPLTLAFGWGRAVPVLCLAAENDTPIPLDGLRELFGRMPPPKRMFILRNADHQHFVDDAAVQHEAVRTASFPAEVAWLPAGMRPAGDLCPPEHAYLFSRGLALSHLDAALRQLPAAAEFLDGDVTGALAARGVAARAGP